MVRCARLLLACEKHTDSSSGRASPRLKRTELGVSASPSASASPSLGDVLPLQLAVYGECELELQALNGATVLRVGRRKSGGAYQLLWWEPGGFRQAPQLLPSLPNLPNASNLYLGGRWPDAARLLWDVAEPAAGGQSAAGVLRWECPLLGHQWDCRAPQHAQSVAEVDFSGAHSPAADASPFERGRRACSSARRSTPPTAANSERRRQALVSRASKDARCFQRLQPNGRTPGL